MAGLHPSQIHLINDSLKIWHNLCFMTTNNMLWLHITYFTYLEEKIRSPGYKFISRR